MSLVKHNSQCKLRNNSTTGLGNESNVVEGQIFTGMCFVL